MVKEKTYTLQDIIDMELYTYISWPEYQDCMDKDWWEEESVMCEDGVLIPVGRAVEMKLFF